MGREFANRIRLRGISCEESCLAATASEVDVAEVASAARVGHPLGTAKAVECIACQPNVAKGFFTNVFE